MNNSIAVPDDRAWPITPYAPATPATVAGGRAYSAATLLDFQAFMRILHHWRWLILGATLVGIALGVVAALLTTPMYRAWVTLEANPPVVEVMDEQSRERAASNTNPWDFIATQVGLLSSRSVAERTAQELNLANNAQFVGTEGDASTRLNAAIGRISAGLSVKAPEEGQLIRFSYAADNPQLAAMVANGIADSFINSNLQRRYEASAYARKFLERQIAKTRADLERSERELVAYAQAQGIINTSSGPNASSQTDTNSLQGESLVSLNKALADAVARRVAAEGAYRQASIGATSEVTSSTQALRQQRATVEAEYQEKRTLMKPDHPDMVSLRSRIDELDRQIARETSQVSSGRTNSLLAEYRAALAAERSLQGRVSALKGSVLNLRGRSIRYNILQRDVDTNRSLYDALLQRYKEIGVAGGIGTTPVSIVDRAQVPGGPYKPNMLFNLLIGAGLGLLAGIGAAVGLEVLNDTVKTREDVRSKLGLACLGAVPKMRANDNFIEDLKNPASMVSEAYSAIVASLRFSTESGTPKMLLVTSTRSGEGKSSTALALAQNFARRDKRVLLVDADLRKPAFKASTDDVGLTKLLTNDEHVDGHVVETQHASLWLLPSGPVPPNPADLLSTPRIRTILAEASQKFDIVVIDGPPTLGLADSPLLAAAAGNVMFVIESGKTRTRAAIESLNRLEGTGTHLVGGVLTKSADMLGGYGYTSYGYGYGQRAVDKKRAEILMIPQGADS